MTTNNPTPGDDLVERLRAYGDYSYAEMHHEKARALFHEAATEIIALRTLDEAARSSTDEEVRRLREALSAARDYVARKALDAFDTREDALLAKIDAALFIAPMATGRAIELREALKPFAELADTAERYDWLDDAGFTLMHHHKYVGCIRLADLRRARAALQSKDTPSHG